MTEQDVARVAKAYLKDSNRTLGVFIPTKTPDRAEIPEAHDLMHQNKHMGTIACLVCAPRQGILNLDEARPT